MRGKDLSGPHRDTPVVALSLRPIHKPLTETNPFGVTVNGLPPGGVHPSRKMVISLVLSSSRRDLLSWTTADI